MPWVITIGTQSTIREQASTDRMMATLSPSRSSVGRATISITVYGDMYQEIV